MKNLYVVAMLAATLAGGTLESASAQSASKTGIKNVVLVHNKRIHISSRRSL
jgi:hypothetical protein